jgi:predicted Zn-dependent protease
MRRTLFLLALCGCAVNPATGKRQLTFISEGQASSLGEESAAAMEKSIGLVDNTALQEYVAGVGARLAAKSEMADAKWSFRTLDDTAVNAFSLPGGHVFVTRGILAHLGSEAQLAGVVGHEIGHVTGKHSIAQMSKATLAQLGIGLGGLVSESFKQYGTPLATAGTQVVFLKYGRDDEYEADMLGVRYCARAGYDLNEFPKVFEMLDRVTKQGGSRSPEWLSTHPAPANRIERIREHIAKAEPTGHTIDDKKFLRQLEGLAYGPDPRQGYFKDTRFIHPVLGFEVTFPAGWKTANSAEAVAAQSPAEDALLQLSVAAAATPEAALDAFLKKEGVTPGTRAAAGASSTFQIAAEGGALGGVASFMTHEGKVYGLIGAAKAEQVAAATPMFEATRASFGPVKDAALRKVEPKRLAIVEVTKATTLAELYPTLKATVPVEEIAFINGLEAGSKLAPGQLVKSVR